jgi:MFS transporter, ACS family, solute carrier family 17 (sodium-dependent inorganic phosphate cotransporter), other
MAEWQYVFGIGALVYIIPAFVFIIFGSGEVQKWNEKKDTNDVVQAT